MRKLIPVLFMGALWCSCDNGEDDGSSPLVADLQAFAFPNTIEPSGQATIAVKVNNADCKDKSSCVVCVGMPGGGGHLFAPAGIDVEDGKSIALQANALALNSLVYVAPNHEGSEVLSAALFKDSVLEGQTPTCSGLSAGNLIATTTVRVVIKNPPPEEMDDSAGAGGIAGSGGTGGTGGAAPIGGGPPGGSGGTAGAPEGGMPQGGGNNGGNAPAGIGGA